MKLFLQIVLSGWRGNEFGNAFLNYASSLPGSVMGADLDSQTPPMIADMVSRLIEQSDEIFLCVLACDPNAPPGSAARIFADLKNAGQKVFHIVLCGEHRTAESILRDFHPRFSKEENPENIRELIRQFSLPSDP